MEPDFASIYDTYETEMLQDAYDTIKRVGLWKWFREFQPHPNEGFMFSSDMNLAIISTSLKNQSHSGASFGWTMRVLHDIAKHGWENHKDVVVRKRCSCRQINATCNTPTID